MEPNKTDAINSLCAEHHPNVGTIIRGKDKDISDISCLTLEDGNNPSFKWEDVEKKLSELQTEYTAQEYARNRQAEYPNWGSQLNKIYDDGLTKWKSEMVDPVKAKWPKDNSGPK